MLFSGFFILSVFLSNPQPVHAGPSPSPDPGGGGDSCGFEDYRNAVIARESSGRYDALNNRADGSRRCNAALNNGQMCCIGAYQFCTDTRNNVGRAAGLPIVSGQEFIDNPELQDQYFDAFVQQERDYLRRVGATDCLATHRPGITESGLVGCSHLIGGPRAAAWACGGSAASDGNGTSCEEYANLFNGIDLDDSGAASEACAPIPDPLTPRPSVRDPPNVPPTRDPPIYNFTTSCPLHNPDSCSRPDPRTIESEDLINDAMNEVFIPGDASLEPCVDPGAGGAGGGGIPYQMTGANAGASGAAATSGTLTCGNLNDVCRDGWGNTRQMDGQLFNRVGMIRDCLMRQGVSNPTLNITSCYRSEAYNQALRDRGVGAVRNSQHIQGTAMDISFSGASTSQTAACARAARDADGGNGGIGVYNSFVHVDTRDGAANW